MKIAALYVDAKGPYPKALGADMCWGEARDARGYAGPWPVVAHPPCARWSKLARSVEVRLGPKYAVGADGGCFEAALSAVCQWGGVLEHPAQTKAFERYGIPAPVQLGWTQVDDCAWVCEVWQSAYGHLASKATWLLYVGRRPPFELHWTRQKGTHVVGYDSKREKVMANPKPTLSASQSIHTPSLFLAELVRLAQWSSVDDFS